MVVVVLLGVYLWTRPLVPRQGERDERDHDPQIPDPDDAVYFWCYFWMRDSERGVGGAAVHLGNAGWAILLRKAKAMKRIDGSTIPHPMRRTIRTAPSLLWLE